MSLSRWRRLALDVRPLRHSRQFRLLYSAAAVSSIGSFVTYVTIPYQVATITKDPLLVGLLGVCELVPILVMGFVGGALADYVDRRRLMLTAELALTALTGVLLLNSLSDTPRLWLLYVVAGLTAAVDGLQRPAMEGLVPRVVTADLIPAASALQSLRHQTASLAGPAVAGLLLASVDLSWVYAADLATFAASLLLLARMRPVPPPPRAQRPSLRTVGEGLRYACSRPELLGSYLVDINAMFFAMPSALYPFVADKMGGPKVLGLLYAAPAVGSLLATLTSGWAGRVRRHGVMVLAAAAAWGVGIIGAGLTASLWVTVACLAFAGAADMISGVFRMSIWNQTIPDHLRGRLAGIEMISYTSGPLLGHVRAGLMARWTGVSGSVVAGGVLCVAGTALLAVALPRFRRYDAEDGLAHKRQAEAAYAAGDQPPAAA
ncbi:MAG TPA: MFS transporter [Pilimelia sp.]|nr:MFS transporter [Pilimelia sp.]